MALKTQGFRAPDLHRVIVPPTEVEPWTLYALGEKRDLVKSSIVSGALAHSPGRFVEETFYTHGAINPINCEITAPHRIKVYHQFWENQLSNCYSTVSVQKLC
jgi:hypothetical protein